MNELKPEPEEPSVPPPGAEGSTGVDVYAQGSSFLSLVDTQFFNGDPQVSDLSATAHHAQAFAGSNLSGYSSVAGDRAFQQPIASGSGRTDMALQPSRFGPLYGHTTGIAGMTDQMSDQLAADDFASLFGESSFQDFKMSVGQNASTSQPYGIQAAPAAGPSSSQGGNLLLDMGFQSNTKDCMTSQDLDMIFGINAGVTQPVAGGSDMSLNQGSWQEFDMDSHPAEPDGPSPVEPYNSIEAQTVQNPRTGPKQRRKLRKRGLQGYKPSKWGQNPDEAGSPGRESPLYTLCTTNATSNKIDVLPTEMLLMCFDWSAELYLAGIEYEHSNSLPWDHWVKQQVRAGAGELRRRDQYLHLREVCLKWNSTLIDSRAPEIYSRLTVQCGRDDTVPKGLEAYCDSLMKYASTLWVDATSEFRGGLKSNPWRLPQLSAGHLASVKRIVIQLDYATVGTMFVMENPWLQDAVTQCRSLTSVEFYGRGWNFKGAGKTSTRELGASLSDLLTRLPNPERVRTIFKRGFNPTTSPDFQISIPSASKVRTIVYVSGGLKRSSYAGKELAGWLSTNGDADQAELVMVETFETPFQRYKKKDELESVKQREITQYVRRQHQNESDETVQHLISALENRVGYSYRLKSTANWDLSEPSTMVLSKVTSDT